LNCHRFIGGELIAKVDIHLSIKLTKAVCPGFSSAGAVGVVTTGFAAQVKRRRRSVTGAAGGSKWWCHKWSWFQIDRVIELAGAA